MVVPEAASTYAASGLPEVAAGHTRSERAPRPELRRLTLERHLPGIARMRQSCLSEFGALWSNRVQRPGADPSDLTPRPAPAVYADFDRTLSDID